MEIDETAGLPAVSEPGSYQVTRFNATRHAVLSKYNVLPWEDEQAYRQLLEALVSDHRPEGETEHYLVEQLASIMWRKRRLRLAELAIHHQRHAFLLSAGAPHPAPTEGQPGALSVLGGGSSEEEKQRCFMELEEYRSKVCEALAILEIAKDLKREDVENQASKTVTLDTDYLDEDGEDEYDEFHAKLQEIYAAGVDALPVHARAWWKGYEKAQMDQGDVPFMMSVIREGATVLTQFLRENVLRWCDSCIKTWNEQSFINAAAFEHAVDQHGLEKLDRYEISLDRKLERTLAMLLKLKDLRRDGVR